MSAQTQLLAKRFGQFFNKGLVSRSFRRHDKVQRPHSPKSELDGLERKFGFLPADFDAAIYLSHNEDVARSVRDEGQAATHYLMHGRAERRTCTKRLVIAVDGHDGSGKSTLAALIAERIGGRIVKPFGGAFGQYMLWLSGMRRYEQLSRIAHEELRRGIAAEADDCPLVIDRHALTMGVLLARPWHLEWRPLANTILCYADVETVVDRLTTRGEVIGREEKHALGISRYRSLAEGYGTPIIDTRDRDPHANAELALKTLGLLESHSAA